MPRVEPVTSASRPASRLGVVILLVSDPLGLTPIHRCYALCHGVGSAAPDISSVLLGLVGLGLVHHFLGLLERVLVGPLRGLLALFVVGLGRLGCTLGRLLGLLGCLLGGFHGLLGVGLGLLAGLLG